MKFITAARQWGKSLFANVALAVAAWLDAMEESAQERLEVAAATEQSRELAGVGVPVDPAFSAKQREAASMYARAHAPRAVRRALRHSRSRLPAGWAAFFAKFPEAERAVRRG